MNSQKMNLIRGLYIVMMLFLFLISIKASVSLENKGGIIGYMIWTRESIYYIALILFGVNAIMYQIDQRRKFDYAIVLGYSLLFIDLLIFQILGIGLIFIGIIFQFLSVKNKI